MSEYVFSCRIDGRAGYVRLWSDALELVRSGRRASKEPEFVWLAGVTQVATTKPGRLFTVVQVVVDGATLNLTFPAADAPRVAELIRALVAAQAEPAPPVEQPLTMFSLPPEPPAAEVPVAAPAAEAPGVEVSPVEVPEFELPDFLPEFAVPDFSIAAPEMPEWTPLPETERPDPVVSATVVDEISALPESPALAAAAALAELEELLDEIPAVVGVAEEPDVASVPGPASVPGQESYRPADLPEEAEKRLSRLEVLRSCGIVTEADYAEAEAEILESVWSEARSA